MIDIFIPVYRESKLLEQLLAGLLKGSYRAKKIFVVADMPSESTEALAKRFEKKVKFILNKGRRGKAKALNAVVKLGKAENILFLDSDTCINSRNFLQKIESALARADIIEIKNRIIKNSFFAKMANYEYMGGNFMNWTFSKYAHKCLGINGASFAIKRHCFNELGGFDSAYAEDYDLATKSLVNGHVFKFVHETEILNSAPTNLHDWLRQRNRWAIGTALWAKKYHKLISRVVIKNPYILAVFLVFSLPSIMLFSLGLILPPSILARTLDFSFILLSTALGVTIPKISEIGLSIVKNVTLIICNLLFFMAFFWAIARKFGYEFSPAEFLVYFFIYNPVWCIIFVIGFIKVFILKRYTVDNWKI